MLIGDRWLEHGQYALKILNTSAILLGTYVPLTGSIKTNLDEKGVLVHLSVYGFNQAGTIVDTQILFDDFCPHEGVFKTHHDTVPTMAANVQPTTSTLPPLDVPTATEVTLRARLAAGGAVTVLFSLWMIAYQVKAWEQAVPPVCFPTEATSRQAV